MSVGTNRSFVPFSRSREFTFLERSPGNLGCILRTAEAAGLRGVVCVGADPYDPEVVGASLGGLFGLDFVRATWPALREACAGRLPLVAATPGGEVPWDEWAWPDAHVLCLGQERGGLPHDLLRACDARVSIPILGAADSPNVATAAGILVHEAVHVGLAHLGLPFGHGPRPVQERIGWRHQ